MLNILPQFKLLPVNCIKITIVIKPPPYVPSWHSDWELIASEVCVEELSSEYDLIW